MEETTEAHATEAQENRKARAIERITEGTGWEKYSRDQLQLEMAKIEDMPMKFVAPAVERVPLRKRARTRSPPRRQAVGRPASRPASQAMRRERTPGPRAYASGFVETHAKRWGPALELQARRQRHNVVIHDPALEDDNSLAAHAFWT